MSGYELYYWPKIPGRGEYVRLALEELGIDYVDVARTPGGMPRMMKFIKGEEEGTRPFAPPFLVHSFAGQRLVIAQTANILQYLGPAPEDLALRLAVHQHQLTIADLVLEAHDTHHPVGTDLYYEDQKPEAARRATSFISQRMPKFLRYFEGVLTSDWLVGTPSYADLSLFQTLEGIAYAFPRAFAHFAPKIPKLMALRERVRERPRIAAYLASPRRIPFNEDGIFRHYPELDTP
jgi:glutathione S-transferase